jgi:FolB domain-containing protein
MDQVFISNLLARGIIGVNPDEREKPQDILINIVIFTDVSRAGVTDDLADCVNYRTIAKKVQKHTESTARFTVEALATDLARLCLDEPGVHRVRVRVEKPHAVRFAQSVGVEIERNQS